MCGEPAAIELVRELVEQIGEEFEVRKYKRLTPLKVANKAVGRSHFSKKHYTYIR